jgi:hypothetical protein
MLHTLAPAQERADDEQDSAELHSYTQVCVGMPLSSVGHSKLEDRADQREHRQE